MKNRLYGSQNLFLRLVSDIRIRWFWVVLYFTVDRVNPWLVRHMDQLIIWVDGGIWDNSIWDPQVDGVDDEEDDISERAQAV